MDPHSTKAKRPIDGLFGSSVRVDLLWFLMRNPRPEYYGQRMLARLIKSSLSEVQRNLSLLRRLGLVEVDFGFEERGPETEEKWGKYRSYRLNPDHPWLPALRMLLENSIGSLHVIRSELQKVEGIDVAFVFGSYATSEQKPESDIDLMIIGRHTLKTISGLISELEERLRREINVVTYSPEYWAEAFKKRSHFVASLMESPKVFMVGDAGKLEEITLADHGAIQEIVSG